MVSSGLVTSLAVTGLLPTTTASKLKLWPGRSISQVQSMPRSQQQPWRYEVENLPEATLHWVSVPAGWQWQVRAAVAPTGRLPLKDFATPGRTLAILNAGYFDPANHKTTSHLQVEGKSTGDPQANERLMGNPSLKAFLPAILNRSEWRRYQCGLNTQYAIARHDEPTPMGCDRIDVVGAGPRLLPTITLQEEAFIDFGPDGSLVRDPLGAFKPNARSAVGIRADGALLLLMVAQKGEPGKPQAGSGFSLAQVAEALKRRGAVDALALDGGTSSSLWVQGEEKTLIGKRDAKGAPSVRPVKSVLELVDLTAGPHTCQSGAICQEDPRSKL
jgi:hypothetical protein